MAGHSYGIAGLQRTFCSDVSSQQWLVTVMELQAYRERTFCSDVSSQQWLVTVMELQAYRERTFYCNVSSQQWLVGLRNCRVTDNIL